MQTIASDDSGAQYSGVSIRPITTCGPGSCGARFIMARTSAKTSASGSRVALFIQCEANGQHFLFGFLTGPQAAKFAEAVIVAPAFWDSPIFTAFDCRIAPLGLLRPGQPH